jgi:signal transduction histidine kinase
MQNAARRMSRLIEDLLRFSRVTTKDEYIEPVDLHDVLTELVSDFDLRIKQSGGRIEVGSVPVVRGSRVQFREVFQNLIGNALKFRKADVAPVIRIDSVRTDSVHRISVSDNGIGFDQKYAERIFRPFERLHGRREYDGSGIGLAICQKVAARYGGRITAESQPGQGSTFVLELPAASEADLTNLEHAKRNA